MGQGICPYTSFSSFWCMTKKSLIAPNFSCISFCSGSRGSDKKAALGESTVPVWLKNELQEAEFIPKLDLPPEDEENKKRVDKVEEDCTTPEWLQAELDEADLLDVNKKEIQGDELSFTEDGDLGVGFKNTSVDKPGASGMVSDEAENDISLQSYLGKSMSKSDCIKLIANLHEKIDRLEAENQTLHKTVAQQLDRITDLEAKCQKFAMQHTV